MLIMTKLNTFKKWVRSNGLWIVTTNFFVIIPICLFITEKNEIYFATLNNIIERDILNTIISVIGSFIAFLGIYLSIAFENFNKNFGKHASKYFIKNNSAIILLGIFIITILLSFLTYIFLNTGSLVSNILFNISCSYFICSTLLIIPYGYNIIKGSSSLRGLKRMVESIKKGDIESLYQGQREVMSVFDAYENAEESNYLTAKDILVNSVITNNSNWRPILMSLFSIFHTFLNDNEIDSEGKSLIIIEYNELMKQLFNIISDKKGNFEISVICDVLTVLNESCAKAKVNGKDMERIFEVIIYIVDTLVIKEDERAVSSAFWAYYRMCKAQLEYNIPKENEIWEVPDDPDDDYGFLWTPESSENEFLFDEISRYCSMEFDARIQRSFLCKNHYITESCIKMLESLLSEILWNSNLGPRQKTEICSSLVFHLVNRIKDFTGVKSFNEFGYLRLFSGNTIILDFLKLNNRLSYIILKEYIELVDYLNEKSLLRSIESGEIGGLGRLIVAYSKELKNPEKSIEHVLQLQQRILDKNSTSQTEETKRICDTIKSDFNSYLRTYSDRNINNPGMMGLIKGFIII